MLLLVLPHPALISTDHPLFLSLAFILLSKEIKIMAEVLLVF